MIRLLYAFFLCSSLSHAQNACAPPDYQTKPELFKKKVEQLIKQGKLQGVSLAIVDKEGLTWDLQLGLRDRDTIKPITKDTIFRIASISKVFNSTALMQASQQGLLSCGTNLSQSVTGAKTGELPFDLVSPNFPNTPITPNLVNNFFGGFQDSDLTPFYNNPTPMHLFLKRAFTGNDNGAIFWNGVEGPGFARCYTNVGSALVAYLVEYGYQQKAGSDKDYPAFTKKYLFDPLDMPNTVWNPDDLSAAAKENLAVNYSWEKRNYTEARDVYPFPFYPAGGLNTSVSEMANFVTMLLNDGVYNGQQILPKGVTNDLGNGVFLPSCNYKSNCQWYRNMEEIYFKFGSSFGVTSVLFVDTATNRGYIGFSNGRNESDSTGSLDAMTEIMHLLICHDRERLNVEFDFKSSIDSTKSAIRSVFRPQNNDIQTCGICEVVTYLPSQNCKGCKQ